MHRRIVAPCSFRRALVHALGLLLCGGSRSEPAVSNLEAALGGQGFVLDVANGGAAVLLARADRSHLSTITSTFSEPGPIHYNFSTAPTEGWTVDVDRSRAASGVWTVTAQAKTYRVRRTYTLDPDQMNPRRVLVNDTISTRSDGLSAAVPLLTDTPGPTNVIGISIKHTATVANSAADVEAALTPGTYGVWQCGSIENPGDTCASPCADPFVKYTNIGRPDVFANRSGFGIGLTALDDVFRVHAQTHQTAKAAAPRMEGMSCPVSDPPAISLADPSFGMTSADDEYTLEWAIYPFVDDTAATTDGCTDYYCFVNAQRHDLQSHSITINQTGFLGPGSSAHSDIGLYNGTGYSQCFDDANTSCTMECQRELAMKSCWEHWSPHEWLDYLLKQAGPGGNAHIDNEDMVGDAPHGCGQIDINGNLFTDPKQRPYDYDDYQWKLINLTRAANELLPLGAPAHQVLRYVDTYASTGVNDTSLFTDSWVTARDGQQQVYENCTKPGGPVQTQMPVFFADGTNSMTEVFDKYFALSFEMGATGIFHDEFPHSAFSYTYLHHAPWDNRSVILDPTTQKVIAVASSLVLLTNENELKLARFVSDNGGRMVCNGAPHTRSWYRQAAAAAIPPNSETEFSNAWRSLHTQLFTPIGLNRYGGNIRDEDPQYNYTDHFPHDVLQRTKFMISPCLSVYDHLQYGVLSMGYDGLWPNSTRENIYAHMTPITPVEIGEGFLIGTERTITSRAGVYEVPTGAGPYRSSNVYTYRHCYLESVVVASGARVEVDWLEPRDIVIIEWAE